MITKLYWHIRQHGLFLTFMMAIGKFCMLCGKWDVSKKSWMPQCRGKHFDSDHGVDTSQLVHAMDLDIDPSLKANASRYEPTSPKDFYYILPKLHLDHSKYTFIDYGSGKGRVVMMAATFPFREIWGVELSAQLHVIARDNIATLKDPVCHNIYLKNQDATSILLPDGPIVHYFFNPFNEYIMRKVWSMIEEDLLKNPRYAMVIYNNPVHKNVFDEAAILSHLSTELGGFWEVYEFKPSTKQPLVQADQPPNAATSSTSQ